MATVWVAMVFFVVVDGWRYARSESGGHSAWQVFWQGLGLRQTRLRSGRSAEAIAGADEQLCNGVTALGFSDGRGVAGQSPAEGVEKKPVRGFSPGGNFPLQGIPRQIPHTRVQKRVGGFRLGFPRISILRDCRWVYSEKEESSLEVYYQGSMVLVDSI